MYFKTEAAIVDLTSTVFTERLEKQGIKISQDGRGRALDNGVHLKVYSKSRQVSEVKLANCGSSTWSNQLTGCWEKTQIDPVLNSAVDILHDFSRGWIKKTHLEWMRYSKEWESDEKSYGYA